MQFDALRLYRERSGDDEIRVSRMVRQGLDDLDAGEVVIRSQYAAVNYKDARAVTGAGNVVKRFPRVLGSPKSQALEAAVQLAHELANFPQRCLRSDRLSAYEQWSLPYEEALRNELRRGIEVVESGETHSGAKSFTRGQGRHGVF